MSDEPLYLSKLWPPVRSGAGRTSTAYELMEAVGLVRRSAIAGIHTLLPLGLRVRDRLAAISRRAFEHHGFATVSFPVLQSRTIWEQSGRWSVYEAEGALFTVSGGDAGDMCLAPTSEEIAVDTVRADLRSYRDLPVRLSLSSAKFRNEVSPRGGLMRAREFEMSDAYTFDRSNTGMAESYRLLNDACSAALSGMGIRGVMQIDADGGSISRRASTEHAIMADFGQSEFLACATCGYRGAAQVISGVLSGNEAPGSEEPVVKVMVFLLETTRRVVAVAIRDELRVSTRKLAAVIGAPVSLISEEAFPIVFGREPGELNPWNAVEKADHMVYDDSVAFLDRFSIADGPNMRSGACWSGFDEFPMVTPVASEVSCAVAGMRCARCGEGYLESIESVELAHVFELGDQYSRSMGLRYVDRDGSESAPLMACSGIGITRCFQTLASLYRDRHGLRWPVGVGPADVHVIGLRFDRAEIRDRVAGVVLAMAENASLVVDDREAGTGDKFTYAAGLGVPYQVVISPRQDPDEVELVDRWTGRKELLSLQAAAARVSRTSEHAGTK
ncbi:aminoacyl--tRNA ligase-related protein [Nocardia gipuzkoensis]